MQAPTSYDAWIDRDAVDATGEKVGSITDVFYDDVTGRPEWVKVKTGMFGGSRFVPIAGAQLLQEGDDYRMQLAFAKDKIKDAPDVDIDHDDSDNGVADHLPADCERELYAHYGFAHNERTGPGTYGNQHGRIRPDADYASARWDRERKAWGSEQRVEEHVEEVPVKTSVEIPVETTVRLRRYQTQKQETRTVQVPVTETEEHVEVADVEAKGTKRA